MNAKTLRDTIKAETIHYSSGYDHYTIVWDAVHTSQDRHIDKEFVREQLDFLRAKHAGIIASGQSPSGSRTFTGSGRGTHRVFFARS